jgi:hypothetical protein
MFNEAVIYKGFALIPLAAYDEGSYAAMLIFEKADHSQTASGVLGTFSTAEEACRYAVEYGMAEIERFKPLPSA